MNSEKTLIQRIFAKAVIKIAFIRIARPIMHSKVIHQGIWNVTRVICWGSLLCWTQSARREKVGLDYYLLILSLIALPIIREKQCHYILKPFGFYSIFTL